MREEKENPLAGKRIVITEPAGSLEARLRALGAEVIELPAIRIEPPSDLRAFAELVQDAHAYDWIVFATPYGVTAFFDLFYKLYDDAREIGGARFAVLGAETAQRLKDFHLHVDLAAEEFAVQELTRELKGLGGIENLRVLLVETEEARDVLGKELAAMGGIVDESFACRIEPETRDENGAPGRFLERGADMITFTTTAAAANFSRSGLTKPNETKVASIGPIVSKTARDHGWKVDLESRRHDVPGLVETIEKFYRVNP